MEAKYPDLVELLDEVLPAWKQALREHYLKAEAYAQELKQLARNFHELAFTGPFQENPYKPDPYRIYSCEVPPSPSPPATSQLPLSAS